RDSPRALVKVPRCGGAARARARTQLLLRRWQLRDPHSARLDDDKARPQATPVMCQEVGDRQACSFTELRWKSYEHDAAPRASHECQPAEVLVLASGAGTREDAFVSQRVGGISERRVDILAAEAWIGIEEPIDALSLGQFSQDQLDGHTRPANDRLSAQDA